MKKILFIALLFAGNHLMAQLSQGTVEYDKMQVPSYISEMPFAPDVSENALKAKFKNMGINGKERKGFWEFRNVTISELSPTPVDAYIKIDRKSRKEKDVTTVYMIITDPGVAPGSTGTAAMAGTPASASNTNGAALFFDSFKTNTADYSLELEIKKQEEELKKAEKKYNNLVDDGQDMQKRLKRLQDDIVDNGKKQNEQLSEVQKQKDVLIQMQARRRSPAKPIQ